MTGKSLSGTTTVAVAGILVVLLMMAGCLGNDQTAAPERITVTGSTTVLPIAEQAREAFEAQDASAEIMVSGGGSSVGVKAAGE
ncbi:MAG: phosphate ABC transporter substrate-binding protein, partial [Methanoculleus sp.]|nr:phosphate ABC transporter substrate-binding protein [Methanoculleus sp.]